MRKLQTKDIFQALRLVKKSNLKEELKPVLEKAATPGIDIQDIGIDGIMTVMEALVEKKSEEALYEFFSGPFEMEPKDIAEMSLEELVRNMERLAEENNLKVFFTRLAGLTTKK